MGHFPDFDTFCRLAAGVHLVPVYRRLLSDMLTPVTACRRIDTGRGACLFESVVGGERVGRYSFVAAGPFLEFTARRHEVTVTDLTGPAPRSKTFHSDDPLEDLKTYVNRWRSATIGDLPPFCSGAVGYAGYDAVRYVEDLPNAPEDDRGLPDLAFAFYDHMLVFDNITKTMTAVAMARLDDDKRTPADLKAAYAEACRRVDMLVEQMATPGADPRPVDITTRGEPRIKFESNFTREAFEGAVEHCLEYIRAGDIFQVVLSQRLKTKVASPPFEIYRTLRVVNPSPFMFYLRTPQVTLVGSSPEILVRCMHGEVTVRPLAGTRPAAPAKKRIAGWPKNFWPTPRKGPST